MPKKRQYQTHTNMTNTERTLFETALSRWGQRNQFDQANEELAELMLELHRIRRGRNIGLVDLASEVADVSIMLDQIKVCFGPEFEDVVQLERERKVNRLAGRVSNLNHKGD